MAAVIDARAALVVIDLQRSIATLPLVHPIVEIARHAAMLADAFRARDLPVVLVNNSGAAPGRREHAPPLASVDRATELLADLRAEASDHRVTKHSPGAFTGTGLEDWLRERSVTQIVVAGVATGTGVAATARQAYELGFNVAFATDAMTDMDEVVHATCVERIFGRFGERGETRELIALLRHQ